MPFCKVLTLIQKDPYKHSLLLTNGETPFAPIVYKSAAFTFTSAPSGEGGGSKRGGEGAVVERTAAERAAAERDAAERKSLLSQSSPPQSVRLQRVLSQNAKPQRKRLLPQSVTPQTMRLQSVLTRPPQCEPRKKALCRSTPSRSVPSS